MQIVKHRAEPIKAIMRSNDGTRIAITRITIMVTIRMVHFSKPRDQPDRPMRRGEGETARASSPQKISIVLTMGRALCKESAPPLPRTFAKKCKWTYFNGIFVSGMTAMKMTIQTDRARGYPFVKRMLDVISSCTCSPNMSRPMTAMLTSRRYYIAISVQQLLMGLRCLL